MGKKNKKAASGKQNGQAAKDPEPALVNDFEVSNETPVDASEENSDAEPDTKDVEASSTTDSNELESVRSKLEELNLQLSDKNEEIEKLKKESHEASETHNTSLNTVKDERDKALAELAVVKESISNASDQQTQSSHKLEAENSALIAKLDSVNNEHAQKVKDLETQLDTTTKAKQETERQYQNLLGRISTIKATLGERLKTDAAELAKSREQVKSLEEQVQMLTDSMETIKRELITSTRENDSLSQQLSATRTEYQSSIGQWEHEHDKLVRQNRSTREEAEQGQNLAKSLEISLLEERTLRVSLGSKISDLEEQISSQTNYAEQYRRERDEAKTSFNKLNLDLQAELKSKSASISSLSEQLERLKEELQQQKEEQTKDQAHIAELEKAKNSIPELEREVREKSLQLGKLRHEAVTLNEHLTKALRMIQKNSQGDTVDKQLVTNMLLSFLSLPRADTKRFEVLQLISNYLGWDDDQNIQAGLSRSSGSSASAAAGLKSPLSPTSRPLSAKILGHDENTSSGGFISMFADFLERESTRPKPNGR